MTKMTDAELVSYLSDEARQAHLFNDGELQEERVKAMRAYTREPYGNEEEGRSAVVASDVFDAVEGMLPDLIEVFTSSEKAVVFEPVGPEDDMIFDIYDIEGEIAGMFPAELVFLEINGITPRPQSGWSAIEVDGVWKFSAPLPPYIDPRPGLEAQLDQIDRQSARPLRALVVANPDIGVGTEERALLVSLEQQAVDIRAELDLLNSTAVTP